MSDSDQAPSWAGADFQQGPISGSAVILCGACKKLGHCRLGLTEERLDAQGVMHARITCPPDHEGGPNVAHGGWTASAMDEILGHVTLLHGALVVTATLTVDFIKPVPIERELEARAWIDSREGRRVYISGELRLASTGALLAKAKGIWVTRDIGHFERHEKWLSEQDGLSGKTGG